MAKINVIIPAQNFESIRDMLGVILTEEINNQYTLSSLSGAPTIWVGRVIPFDKTEIPAINISLSTIDYNNKDQRSVDGQNLYDIDIYTSAPFTDNERGDKAALIACHKLAGMCRAILENPVYKTLDFAPGFIQNTGVSNIRFIDPVSSSNTPDATNQTVGRIEFGVRCKEGISIPVPMALQSAYTHITLEQTPKGYYYEYVKPVNIFTEQFSPEFE